MTAGELLSATAKRLPTATELMALCDDLGIGFGLDGDGRPSLKVKPADREVGALVVGLLRREPWRSEVLAAKQLVTQPPIECRWRYGHVFRHHFPEQGWPVGAGWWRYVGEGDDAWQPIPGREMARGEVPFSLPEGSNASAAPEGLPEQTRAPNLSANRSGL